MLRLEGIPPQVRTPCTTTTTTTTTTSHNAVSQFVLLSNKTHRTHLSLCSNRKTQFVFSAVLGQSRSGFSVHASKIRRKGGNTSNTLLEMEGVVDEDFEDDGDFDVDDDDDEDVDMDFADEDGDIDDEDEELFVPLRNMKKWTENKPSGFGEGKVYDTFVEDKLLEEIELSREAQIANINALKNNPEKTNSDKEVVQKQKAAEVLPSGIRVRLLNLPKKKNVHRDLQLAFKGVPGMVNIKPVVLGNKKTRDPICKGIAFVEFKSEDEAYRFVQIFSKQQISFGKIQKQIKCEIVNPNSPNTTPREQSTDGTCDPPQLVISHLEDDPETDFGIDDRSLESLGENDKYEVEDEEIKEDLVNVSLSEPSGSFSMEPKTESATKSSSPEQQEKIKATKKKPQTKRKGEKVPKLSIPGSANRLKIKEKAVLTDVFSKYGLKASSVGKEQS